MEHWLQRTNKLTASNYWWIQWNLFCSKRSRCNWSGTIPASRAPWVFRAKWLIRKTENFQVNDRVLSRWTSDRLVSMQLRKQTCFYHWWHQFQIVVVLRCCETRLGLRELGWWAWDESRTRISFQLCLSKRSLCLLWIKWRICIRRY